MNLQVGNWELTCTELSPVSMEHHPMQDLILSSLHLILLQSGMQPYFLSLLSGREPEIREVKC